MTVKESWLTKGTVVIACTPVSFIVISFILKLVESLVAK